MTTETTTSAPTSSSRPARPRLRRRLLFGLAALGATAAAVLVVAGGPDPAGMADPVAAAGSVAEALVPELEVRGIADGAVLSAATVADATVVVTTTAARAGTLRVLLDGEHVAAILGTAVVPSRDLALLEDGEHTLEATVAEGGHVVTRRVGFLLDTTAPDVALPDVVEVEGYGAPLAVRLRVTGATHVTAAEGEVELGKDGNGTARFERAPTMVSVTAADAAGNTTTAELPVVTRFPGGRAVHTTPSAWRYEPKRTPIIQMLEAGLIDAVQMDIKDELGDVGWDTGVELADLSGAEDFNRNFDMAAAIETIHSHGARVIGRLVVYRDTRLAKWAWNNGEPDMVLQATDGSPYQGRYGDYAFTNFAHPQVQKYNLDIALEAAELGFDDILYDYIRRPDGAIDKLVIPGLEDRTPQDAVVEVMATAYPLLRERGVWVGASVFGIAIDRPTQMAQSIPLMTPHVDYIAPMVYPNHWNLGEYGVPVPEEAPYEIVERSLTLYRDVLADTDTALMPWLQDFGGYGEAEVRAQIDATEAVTGERSFLLWASSATYTDAALDPIEPDAP